MAHPQDFRRATEPELLDAIRDGQPLALAEAYHRAVPAAHAVARRLMPGAADVEAVLLQVFSHLWEDPPVDSSTGEIAGVTSELDGAPTAPPALEAWVRRTTWAVAAERLRAGTTAPASPSASGLLPDLPKPDVRFLDAAERAIEDLDEDERRALLLAHDKGVPSSSQERGADEALVRALLALAGPESSAGDRGALDDDPCLDLLALGDWALGIADADAHAAVTHAIETRPGCAAKSRAVRRGRRRIEGLPATPDMGQRVLVSVLTSSNRGMGAADQPPVAGPVAVVPELPPERGLEDMQSQDPSSDAAEDALGDDAALVGGVPDGDATEGIESSGDAGSIAPEDADAKVADDVSAEDDDDPFADLDADPFAPSLDTPDPSGEATLSAGAQAGLIGDTADLPAATEASAAAQPSPEDSPSDGDWTPNPGDTAELRLSDILSGGEDDDEDDDDPFADLARELSEPDDEPAAAPIAGSGPYAALQDLNGPQDSDERSPFGVGGNVSVGGPARADATVVDPESGVYIEGQDLDERDPHESRDREDHRASPLAAALAWILPILGGLAVGVLLAVQVFGPPSGS